MQVVLGGRAHTIVGVLPEQFLFALNPVTCGGPFPVDAGPGGARRSRVRVRGVVSPRNAARRGPGTAALDDVSRTIVAAGTVVATRIATAIAGGATRTLGLLAGRGRRSPCSSRLPILRGCCSCDPSIAGASWRWERRSARAASEIARQLLLEAETLVAMGIAGWRAARVVADAGRRPACAGAVRRRGEPRGGGELARDWRSWRWLRRPARGSVGCCRPSSRHDEMLSTCCVAASRRRPVSWRLRRVFVTGEVALAFVLLVCADARGPQPARVLNVNPGFDARGVLTLHVSLPGGELRQQRAAASFYSALQTALEQRLGTPHDCRSSTNAVDRRRRPQPGAASRPTRCGREAVVRAGGDRPTSM